MGALDFGGECGSLVYESRECRSMLEGFVEVSPILKPGVYALVRNGVVVYVGKAGKAAIARIAAHRSNWGRKSMPAWMPVSLRGVLFDQVYILPCLVDDLDTLEAAMIDLYKPRYNIRLKTPYASTTPLELTINGHVIPMNQRTESATFVRRL